MEIKLAGYNVDADQLGYHITDNPQDMTPETISAAYARISRSEKNVDELRAEAAEDVAKARASNEKIVFEMGHNTVAEHAVFNFDIMGVSRLAIEAIEHSRLNSYLEKSQRYLKLKGLDEVHTPAEITGELRNQFVDVVSLQMDAYQVLYKGIFAHLVKAYTDQLDRDGPAAGTKLAMKGKAKEDARYVTGLAVTGQLGMTINARNLETMVRRLAGSPLKEVQSIGEVLHREARQVTPSLLRYCEAEPVRQMHTWALPTFDVPSEYAYAVSVVDSTKDSFSSCSVDNAVLTGLIFQNSRAPHVICEKAVAVMAPQDKWRAFLEIHQRMEMHSAAPRAFELPDVTFEMAGSASFFAQLKRHRMATILPQAYDTRLGCTVPKTIRDAGLLDVFEEVREKTETLHRDLQQRKGVAVAEYVLVQAHRRRVLIKMNARQLYAFARLREDSHAQWEIREAAHLLIQQARERMPMTLALACGKDEFVALRKRVMETSYL